MEFTNGRIAEQILEQAALMRASDVHIEPEELQARIRLRIDGVLQELDVLPLNQYTSLITQLKVLSGMDIAEKRVPQDGHWELAVQGRKLDIRLASLPTINGEKMAVRLLDREQSLLSLGGLDFSEANSRLYAELYNSAHGLIFITGPTGSGKTTTLYATLQALDSAGKNIITVEEPVEYKLAGINQVMINRKAGMDFALGLRALVRQDPDIIMIGEVRDKETAAMAVQAALTGHLVFSTLHTNSAAGALTRLADMGIERYFIAGALSGVLSQRLVRRLCPRCKKQAYASIKDLEYLRRGANDTLALFYPGGCEYCRGTGYYGRIAVHEILPVNDIMRRMIVQGSSEEELLEQAALLGWRSLYWDGADKAVAGLTSVEELRQAGIYERS